MDNPFPILAIETSGDLCSAAVLLDANNFVEINHLQKNIHSEKLMEMVDIVINQGKISLNHLAGIAISIGPGSFTGLRIGMSAVKGLAFAANLPLIPVPTFDAFALQLSNGLAYNQKFNIIINASIDDCYFAKYINENVNVKALNKLKLVDKNDLEKSICEEEINFGNVLMKSASINSAKLTASSIARWAYLFGKDLLTFDYDNLEPFYLKEFVGKVKT